MPPASASPAKRPRVLFPLLTLIAILAGGCASSTQQGGQDLSAAGVKAANGLADYYDQLADYALDVSELTAVNTGLQGLADKPAGRTIIDTTNAQYQKIAHALRRRAAMARSLAALYASVGNLAAYDARGAVGAAAGNLSAAVTALPDVAPQLDFDPKNLVTLIAGDLAALKQAGDVRAASAAAADVLAHVADFVDAERGAGAGVATDLYAQVVAVRADRAGEVTRRLIERKLVDATAVMAAFADGHQIPWDGRVADDDASTRAAAAAVAADQARRQAALTATAGNDIVQALRALAGQHRAFAQGGAFNPAGAAALVERAQTYLDEVEKVKKQARDTRAARRDAERQQKAAAATTRPSA